MLAAVAYAWWATGVAPFTLVAYVLVAVPSLAMVASYAAVGAFDPRRTEVARHFRRRAAGVSLAGVAPWLAVLGGIVALEIVGLALGGRSQSVPTLSTAVDHLLVTHWGRCLLFVAWLGVGARPLVGLARRPRAER